ncbi:5-formyltetrahydrofolate cyclo-ligase [Schlegelella sp. ID0723]|uniref:5-formyltetrahydrofolate cyclo-ligase n=1 Tax=Piscinibacter koreensis TaxID=2742824 RepID=A0A7Y6TWX1_9BURK|nr:5-formyltetrahydrofolate cyclo-ligase [Schlegelella koreensis]
MRRRLIAERAAFAAGDAAADASRALAAALAAVIVELEPDCLGVYSPMRHEFNVADALEADSRLAALDLALPFARRDPVAMEYRRWDRRVASLSDELGLPTGAGPRVVPDVVLVPCVGFSADGWRLGYGGGYFDRWLAAHPHVTSVGVAWSFAEIDAQAAAAAPHDQLLTLVVTERGVVGA